MAPTSVRIAIADDHPVVRRGLRAYLDAQPGFLVVAEAADGKAIVRDSVATQPDVILLDLLMPHGGADAVRELRLAVPAAQIVVLTSSEDRVLAAAVLACGALSYLLKDSAPETISDALAAAARGQPCIHPRIAATLQQAASEGLQRLPLSEREQDVLDQIAAGHGNAEIAARLGSGIKTVKTHVSNVLAKLGVADRTQAAVLALREGLTRT